VTASHS